MKKIHKMAACAAAACLALPLVLGVAACFKNNDGWERFSGEQIEESEVRVSVDGGSAYIRWKGVDGADGYNVYRSESRFGDYYKINGDSLVKTNRYKTDNCAYWYYKIKAVTDGKETEIGTPSSVFSDNTLIVSPDDDMEEVQRYIDDIHDNDLEHGQFSSTRFAVMFKPGDYPDIDMKTGYYTSVYGLGEVPTDVTIGNLYVSANVLSGGNATCTFWRSVENFTTGTTRFAVSQATSIRRMQFNGDLKLAADQSEDPSYTSPWSSGGFLANSVVTGTVEPRTQQQWMSRNDSWGRWNGASNHNYVYAGCVGNTPADAFNSSSRSTVLETTEKMAEKPFIYCDQLGDYKVFVPAVQTDTKGVTWQNGRENEAGEILDIDDFYIANEKIDNDETINKALSEGKNILLTPGHYKLNKPIEISGANTVFMGMGYATLEISDSNARAAVKIADVDGVRVGDILVDAGEYSANMIVVGEEGKTTSHADNPIVLSNIFLRIGGVENKHTETSEAMVINANDTLGDNFWIWRADHSRGVAWNDVEGENGRISYGNPVDVGLLVNGDNVKCYALMVEHTEGYQTYWKGENGLTVMYQSETPYNVPDQSEWTSYDGAKNGRASYKVDDGVQTHRAYGIGVYLVNTGGARVELDSAIEVPVGDGIYMHHLVTCCFAATSKSIINNVVNDVGSWVGDGSSRRIVEHYPL